MNSSGEFTSSFAGEFTQSLLLERNRAGSKNVPLYINPGFKRYPAQPNQSLFTHTSNFVTGKIHRSKIPDDLAAKLYISDGTAFSGGGFLVNAPSTGGIYRAYFHFRAVCESFPFGNVLVEENKEFLTPFPEMWAIAGSCLRNQTTNISTIRLGGIGTYGVDVVDLILNRRDVPMGSGLVYMDRIISVSIVGNGAQITAGTAFSNWSRAPRSTTNIYQGGAPEGIYLPSEITDAGTSLPTQNAASVLFYENWFGRPYSLTAPFGKMISDANLAVAQTTENYYQHGQVQFLGFLAEPSIRPEEYIDLQISEEP